MQPCEPQYDPLPELLPRYELSGATYASADADESLVGGQPEDIDGDSEPQDPQPPAGAIRAIVGWGVAAVIVAAVLLAATGNPFSAEVESAYMNWIEHLQPLAKHNASRQSSGKRPQLVHLSKMAGASYVDAIALGEADTDDETTRNVLTALQAGNESEALRQLAAAQSVPSASARSQAELQPQLTPGMRSELLSGDARFFHIYLYDCCVMDGDVVEVLVNGKPFAIVPITHRGATLSIPVGQGTQISLRGIRDGEGGITVACRTSQGEFFMSAMAEGEEQTISLVH